ncbi:phiSA1p31-related protein [Streptomyces sp. A3M-1-3]|uniref:phiSA1p31-related protein n=1 Tax=Streptomyces sp. A3M-1-3 TaxID=2962044 RepID=UPI0020B81E30|nr:phiSA1p31-related protein [Streptomyces sp. A3M-1-3]MCP3820127.1 phiSA1p31-related protein [Streptomyces sp. A3M-1-3]
MTAYLHDGTEFDLDRTYVDVVGVEWSWTGEWTEAGEPLMRGGECATLVPLPDVYRDHGPLIPVTVGVPAGLRAAVLAAESPLAVDLAAGYAESLEQYTARTAAAKPAPVPMVPAAVRRGFFARLAQAVAR